MPLTLVDPLNGVEPAGRGEPRPVTDLFAPDRPLPAAAR